ncbi:hypothetical protein [Bacillus altitudinis]
MDTWNNGAIGSFVADLVLQVLSWVAEEEREPSLRLVKLKG